MKEFIKSKWFLLVTAIAGISLVVSLYNQGFRITYAPELENNWNAISAVASWGSILVAAISACASFLAVWYTIKIAEKQKKIDLFNKRYAVYKTLEDCNAFYQSLKDEDFDDSISIRIIFLSIFDKETALKEWLSLKLSDDGNSSIDYFEEYFDVLVSTKCKQIISILHESKFLFAEDPKIFEDIKKITTAFSGYIICSSECEKTQREAAKVYFQRTLSTHLLDKLLEKISQFLRL